MIPAIETPRLTLRGFQPSDLEALGAILSDREVIRWIPRNEPWPIEIVQKLMNNQRLHWEAHGWGWYAVECREDRALIGWCGLSYLPETKEVEIKYLLKRSHWGRGYATEGAQRCIADGFAHLDLEEIVGLVFPENTASRHVLEKLGLRYTARLPYFGFDLDRFAITRCQYSPPFRGEQEGGLP